MMAVEFDGMSKVYWQSLPVLNRPSLRSRVPTVPEATQIPRLIHQTFSTKLLPPEIEANITSLRRLNPGWQYHLYDDSDIAGFIDAEYGAHVLHRFEQINPLYGAARADLFRYLLLYKVGGVYLDIKSASLCPLDGVLRPDDRYLLSVWNNRAGEAFEGWGLHPELADVEGGEFQQWYIAAAPGHPFLKAVIETVLRNIDVYNPALHGIGKRGVLRLTGPIAYTRAILPLLGSAVYRRVDSEADLGLRYTIYTDSKLSDYKALFKAHYANSSESIVHLGLAGRWVAKLLFAAKWGIRSLRPSRA